MDRIRLSAGGTYAGHGLHLTAFLTIDAEPLDLEDGLYSQLDEPLPRTDRDPAVRLWWDYSAGFGGRPTDRWTVAPRVVVGADVYPPEPGSGAGEAPTGLGIGPTVGLGTSVWRGRFGIRGAILDRIVLGYHHAGIGLELAVTR